jgi:hypothetical protein
MSQQVRRVLAALGLTAALLLAAPAPSRAAGLRGLPAVPEISARVWAWLEGLLPAAPAPSRRPARGEKQTSSPVYPTAPATSPTSDQGSAIDPNGYK